MGWLPRISEAVCHSRDITRYAQSVCRVQDHTPPSTDFPLRLLPHDHPDLLHKNDLATSKVHTCCPRAASSKLPHTRGPDLCPHRCAEVTAGDLAEDAPPHCAEDGAKDAAEEVAQDAAEPTRQHASWRRAPKMWPKMCPDMFMGIPAVRESFSGATAWATSSARLRGRQSGQQAKAADHGVTSHVRLRALPGPGMSCHSLRSARPNLQGPIPQRTTAPLSQTISRNSPESPRMSINY